MPLVYDELRKLAAARMAREAPGQTLQPTALVHEAWLRLAGSDRQQWQSRGHFFGAAEAMRPILIDLACSKASQKRGRGEAKEEFHESRFEFVAPSSKVLPVHEALDALAAEEPVIAQVVKLHYFVGMTLFSR